MLNWLEPIVRTWMHIFFGLCVIGVVCSIINIIMLEYCRYIDRKEDLEEQKKTGKPNR